MSETLFDQFGRRHNYLRISLTDKCNFRCSYCMPSEKMKFMPDERLMSAKEIGELASVFVRLGVSRIRLTGGEPTLREDLADILKVLNPLGVRMSMTTNGLLLSNHLESLLRFGLNELNISLDSVDEDTFTIVAKRKVLNEVIRNIDLSMKMGFQIKINMVVIRGVNHNEVLPMLKWTSERGLPIRFIEYMPFFGNEWEYKKVFSAAEILDEISSEHTYFPETSTKDSTSVNYLVPEINARFGIISTVTNPFCSGCSRIRLTADGKIRNCLFSGDETDLLTPLRAGEDIVSLIRSNISRKKEVAAGLVDFNHENARLEYAKNRPMVTIGG